MQRMKRKSHGNFYSFNFFLEVECYLKPPHLSPHRSKMNSLFPPQILTGRNVYHKKGN